MKDYRCIISQGTSTFVSVILQVVYGKKVAGLDDEYLHLVHKSLEGLSLQKVPGAFWVEYFPWLKIIPSWIPGARFKKIAEHYKPIVETMINQPFDEVVIASVRSHILLLLVFASIRIHPPRRMVLLHRPWRTVLCNSFICNRM